LCWGTDDKLFPVSLGRRLADTFPNGSLRLVHGAGALVSLDAPEAVADSITACAS
jgi:pimeloyl-ACP methyl ester carboxylesterase